jgi:GNAT superfamily N-acetyltransferase
MGNVAIANLAMHLNFCFGPEPAADTMGFYRPEADIRCRHITNEFRSFHSMNIQGACPSDAPMIASVLQEASDWLARDGRPLWSAADISLERILRDTTAGLFHVARAGEVMVGVMKFELEDAYFWPEVQVGTSAFIHKLAIRRAWAKKGASTELLSFAQARAQQIGRSYLRLDCVADRQGLRNLYENFGFVLHSVVQKGAASIARYELPTTV